MVLTELEKENKRIAAKKYYEKNKEKKAEYYKKNREKIAEARKEYRETNQEQIKEKKAEYYKKNREKIVETNKEYRETPEGRKSHFKSCWKSRGLDIDTFYYVYPIYLATTHCDRCNVLLEGIGNNKKCMDHCHATGMYRNTVCKKCNLNVIPYIKQ